MDILLIGGKKKVSTRKKIMPTFISCDPGSHLCKRACAWGEKMVSEHADSDRISSVKLYKY